MQGVEIVTKVVVSLSSVEIGVSIYYSTSHSQSSEAWQRPNLKKLKRWLQDQGYTFPF